MPLTTGGGAAGRRFLGCGLRFSCIFSYVIQDRGSSLNRCLHSYILNTPQSPESPSAPISPRPPLPPELRSLDARSSAASSSPRPRTSLVSDGSMIPSSYLSASSKCRGVTYPYPGGRIRGLALSFYLCPQVFPPILTFDYRFVLA